MATSNPAYLPIARLILTVRADATLQLPVYAGSMLRGAFGYALQDLAIPTHRTNQACAVHDNCPYCQVFAPPPLQDHTLQKFTQMPASYVIEPPRNDAIRKLQAGQTFEFGLVLIGNAFYHLPVIIKAFERAMKHGLSSRNTTCTLLAVRQEHSVESLWQPGWTQCTQPTTTLPPATGLGNHIALRLHSPMRLQLKNKPARLPDLNARTLLITLARRYQLLMDVHLGQQIFQQDFTVLEQHARNITLDTSALHWRDWERYSNRQRQSMKLGGLMGTLHLYGDLSLFSDLLHLGQWLHVGKETAFGLGGYTLQMPECTLSPQN